MHKHIGLTGSDVSLEISLCEYGLAWRFTDEDVVFYYAIEYSDGQCSGFDWCSFPKDMDVAKEFDCLELESVSQFVGLPYGEWLDMPLERKIEDLVSYYGYEEVFGTSYHGVIFTAEELLNANVEN